MPTIEKILADERGSENATIRFYIEGLFCKAYERSAWKVCMLIHKFSVKKRLIKKINQEVVSIGFPISSQEKWCGRYKQEICSDGFMFRLSREEVSELLNHDYDEWKRQIDTSAENPDTANTLYKVCDEIKRFPIENKTPMDCMIFVSRLKQILG